MIFVSVLCVLMALGQAEKCRLCNDEAQLVKRKKSDKIYCWGIGSYYKNSVELKSVPYTTVYDCEQLCLKEKACIGATVTSYLDSTVNKPMFCVLTKSGSFYKGCRCKCKKSSATKECMEKNRLKPCSDSMDCWEVDGMCGAKCRFARSLVDNHCRKTCGICNDPDDPYVKKEWKPAKKKVYKWKTLPKQKFVGEAVVKFARKNEQKAKDFIMCWKFLPYKNARGVNCNKKACVGLVKITHTVPKDNYIALAPEE